MSTFLTTFRTFEPARLRAIWTAAIALAATLGLAVPSDLDGRVVALIGLVSVLLPILQGETTRAVVTPAVLVPEVDPADYAEVIDPDEDGYPEQTDNSARPEDGEQGDLDQSPTPDLGGLDTDPDAEQTR